MAFKPSIPVTESNDTQKQTASVDYDAQRAHVIEQAGTQNKHRVITGYIGAYYSLGKQKQKPYQAIYDEKAKDFDKMKANVEAGKATVELGNINIEGTWHNDVQVYSAPRPPREAIALGVYFPQIIVDRDKFVEGSESNPRPLMMVMGGETFVPRLDESGKNEKVIQYPTFIQENTNNPSGTWGLGQTTTLHKMGLALDLLNEHNLMKVDKLGDMLGKPLQFKMRIWDKPTKNGGTWFTEEIKFVSEVPEGLTPPVFDESYIHGINFNEPNDIETVKHLRTEIVNTIKRAVNFEGSIIQKELKEVGRLGGNTPSNASESSQKSSDEHEQSPSVDSKASQNAIEKQESVTTYNEPPMDFSDEIPF
jgi:hypothetical protein